MNQKRFFTWGAALVLVVIGVLVSIRAAGAQTRPDPTLDEPFTQSPNMTSASYSLNWDVIANSSGVFTSTSYRMQSTLGQNAIGTSSSASYSLHAGFWQLFNTYRFLPLVQR